MLIANPMYDVVFKFLLEDNASAKLLIGTIIGEEILALDFRPQERSHRIDAGGERFLTVYRMDFAARIRNAAGEERQVLIELQKAKYPTDIMRFRRYLGSQYSKEPFIEGLTHDSYIIQIPELHRQRRTEVERMLQIFDQRLVIDDKHVLELDETEVPPAYRPLVRRLQLARAEREIAEVMELEDEILEELQEHERAQERLRQRAEQAQAQAEQAQAQAEQAQAQAEQAQAQAEQAQAQTEQERLQKEQERERAEQAQAQAEQERARNDRLRALLQQAGIDPDETSGN